MDRRSRQLKPLSVVDVASIPESYDHHQEHVVLDGVDEAIVADTDAKSRPALERPRARRPRIVGEQSNGALEASASLGVELAQGPDHAGTQLDPVRAHSHPRSTLT